MRNEGNSHEQNGNVYGHRHRTGADRRSDDRSDGDDHQHRRHDDRIDQHTNSDVAAAVRCHHHVAARDRNADSGADFNDCAQAERSSHYDRHDRTANHCTAGSGTADGGAARTRRCCTPSERGGTCRAETSVPGIRTCAQRAEDAHRRLQRREARGWCGERGAEVCDVPRQGPARRESSKDIVLRMSREELEVTERGGDSPQLQASASRSVFLRSSA